MDKNINTCESTLMCSVQSKFSGRDFHPASHFKNTDYWPDDPRGGGAKGTHPVSSLAAGWMSSSSVHGQGSISIGMIVRMMSSFPRRTTTRKLLSFLMIALTSVAVEIRWPLMEMMTSCSLSPPLQKRQTLLVNRVKKINCLTHFFPTLITLKIANKFSKLICLNVQISIVLLIMC